MMVLSGTVALSPTEMLINWGDLNIYELNLEKVLKLLGFQKIYYIFMCLNNYLYTLKIK